MIRNSPALIATLLLLPNLVSADDEFKKIVAKIRKTADTARSLVKSVKSETTLTDGKKKVFQKTEFDIREGKGRNKVFNKDSIWVFAANEKNAFHIIQDDFSLPKWRIQQFADRNRDQRSYESLWNFKFNNYVDSIVGHEGCRGLIGLWDGKQIKLKSIKKNDDGILEARFTASDSVARKLADWEIKRSRIDMDGDPKSLDELRRRQLELGPRPTEFVP